MKTCIKNLYLLRALITGLCLIPAGRVTAQTFTTLHSFTAGSGSYPVITNSDGALPEAVLILSGNILYGTTYTGGSSGYGTVFAISTDGTGFTNLHNFTRTSVPALNRDGAFPYAVLILSGNTLYGTTSYGGNSDNGTVFAINTDGSSFRTLYSFTGLNPPGTNSDGALPWAGLILSGNTLYGTASHGGSSGSGTVFAVNTDGTDFTTLHSFTATTPFTNSDGALPWAGLILSDTTTLYGTAQFGSSTGKGTLFAVNTDGTGFRTVHDFGGGSDGAEPLAGLILSDNTLYGTTFDGGSSGFGAVFKVNTDGTDFTSLHRFTAGDGGSPYAGLVLSGSTLYGTAYRGGSSGNGTVFSLSLSVPPRLTILPDGSGGYFIRVQGASNLTCRLQRATSVTGPWTSSAPQTGSASGFLEFHDLFPPPGQAFYRTVQP
jgi:uncharacterized repeat protein (TIGR03803 family)